MSRSRPQRYQLGTGDLVTPAPFLDRIAARLVDVVVMLLAIAVVELVLVLPFDINASMGFGEGVSASYAVGMAIAGASLVILYEVWTTSWRGHSLGKRNVGLRVIRIRDGKRPPLLESFARTAMPVAAGASGYGIATAFAARWPMLYGVAAWMVVGLSFLLDPCRRGWHDKLTGTVVVRRVSERTSGQRRRSVLDIEPHTVRQKPADP
ncbi:MAG: RDD family protein [Acidimicrobiales bacterium]|nr:RDD family protein [Acidimicrobiales bacterium]